MTSKCFCIVIVCFLYFAHVGDALPYMGGAQSFGECSTERCRSVGQEVYSMFNTSADPCEYPQSFFCGSWVKAFHLPDEEEHWTASFSRVRENVRMALRKVLDQGEKCPTGENSVDSYDSMVSCFYESCMDTDQLDEQKSEYLINYLKSDSPFLYSHAIDPSGSAVEGEQFTGQQKVVALSNRIAQWTSAFGINVWLDIGVHPSPVSDSGNFSLRLTESGLSLQFKQYEQVESVSAYLDYISELLDMFTQEVAKENVSAGRITSSRQRAEHVLQMEQDIKMISLKPDERRNQTLIINLLSRDEIRHRLKGALDFDVAFDPLFSVVPKNSTENDMNAFIVDHPLFLDNLAELIRSTWRWEVIHDYLLLKNLKSAAQYLSQPYREASDRFSSRMRGSVAPPRWRQCQELTSRSLGWMLSRRYVASVSLPRRRKAIAEHLIKELRVTFAEVIREAEWMDEPTKQAALKKLSVMGHKLAFPEWLLTEPETYFNKYYGSPNSASMRVFVLAPVYVRKQIIRFQMGRLGQPEDPTEWHMYPYEVNAYFEEDNNEIVFPLSILQEPFVRVWTDCEPGVEQHCSTPEEIMLMKTLTFGSLGSIVGHEVTHGFDDRGRELDERGKKRNWWSPRSAAEFDGLVNCVAHQYDQFALQLHRPGIGRQAVALSGRLTLGETIADGGGIKLAYLTLQRLHPEYFNSSVFLTPTLQLSPKMLFFSGYAQTWCDVSREKYLLQRISGDVHPPGIFRIIGTLTNFDQFAAVFSCVSDSTCNPTNNASGDFQAIFLRSLQERYEVTDDNRIFIPTATTVQARSQQRCPVW